MVLLVPAGLSKLPFVLIFSESLDFFFFLTKVQLHFFSSNFCLQLQAMQFL